MNTLLYNFYTSRIWARALGLVGRVPYGTYVGHSATLEDLQRCVGPGWDWLVRDCFDAVRHDGGYVAQVKEKFGGLRFYAGGLSDGSALLVSEAEGKSLGMCEICGAEGWPDADGCGWVKTLCTCHHQSRRRWHTWPGDMQKE